MTQRTVAGSPTAIFSKITISQGEQGRTMTSADADAHGRDMVPDFAELPPAQSHRLIDFDTVEIMVLESFPEQYVLVVRGVKPYLNMRVSLVPLVYIRQPDYWGIEVVGRLPGIGLPAQAPYTVSISLNGIIGTEGIEVIGANKSVRECIPPTRQPLPPEIFQRWKHSFEEDSDGVAVYRPFVVELPPARGRDGFALSEDGGFIRYDLGPGDGLVEVPGRWSARTPEEIDVVFDNPRIPPMTLHVLSLSDQELRIST